MAPQNNAKPKRHKKRKSRTEVSSDSDSEPEIHQDVVSDQPSSSQPEKATKKAKPSSSTITTTAKSKSLTDAEVEAAFTKFYMQRLTTEFSEDLDKLRKADDFKDDALPLLIGALQQGTSLFGMEEKRRIVVAGLESEGKEGGSG
ncbi:hypothetical protein EG329_007192 [Mollisiaceae sp. DMI_Dod_QoI]|nr:hypothetical protein EG329_007192 [Helotiales sp. DMI_Dod_QoI]